MRNSLRITSLASAVALSLGLAACVAPPPTATPMGNAYPSSSYPSGSVSPAYVEFGRVSNVELLQTQEQGRGSGVGAIIGGVAGAVVGRQIGGGSGRDAATVVGAVGGAVAGNAIERNRNSSVRESYRISIQLDNGPIRQYEVPSPGDLRVGDRVRIENGQINRMM